jgi:ATP-dependent Clp protease protease subunit
MKEEFNNKATSNVLVPSVRDKDGTGYDIFSLLLKERIIVVQGQVETAMAGVIISQLHWLEHLDPTKPIKMMINSPGGSVIDGLAILDVMRAITSPIITIGNGMQASMGSILLAGGDQRYMTKNSMVLVHQIMGGAEGGTQHTDFESSGSFMAQLHEKLKSVYVEFIGFNHKFWDIVGERDSWLNAEQALKLGYVHGVVEEKKAGGPYANEAVRTKTGLQAEMDKATKGYIAQMSADEVTKAINDGNAEGGLFARLRGELIMKLSEFPEFWTEAKKQEMKASNVANDNTGKASGSKKTIGGPKNQ